MVVREAVPERGGTSARRAAASDRGGYVNSRAADERKPLSCYRHIEAILFGQAYELPTLADVNFLLGYGMQSEGKHREAVRVFAPNLETKPPHLMSLFMSANSRMLGGFELEKAIAELGHYIELAGKDAFPPVSMAWARKGAAFKKLGKIDEAIRCYKKVLELDSST